MKIKQISENELYFYKGAVGARLSGALSTIVGVGVGVSFFTKAEGSQDKLIAFAIITGALIISALCIMLPTTVKIFLRRGGQSEVTKKRLIGGPHTDTFDTQSVRSVVHTTETRISSSTSDNGSTRERVGNVTLLLDNGDNVELFSSSKSATGGFTGISSLQTAPLRKEAEQIANFLGVPLSHEGDLSTKEAFNEVKSMIQGEKPQQTPTTVPPQVSATPSQPTYPSPQQPVTPPVQPLPQDQPTVNIPPTNPQEQKKPQDQTGGNVL